MRTRVTYRIFWDDAALTAARVTKKLALTATTSVEAGTKTGRSGASSKVASWFLASGDVPEDNVELSAQLHRVLAALTPKRAAPWDLVAAGYRVDWWCYLGSHPLEHAAELPRELLVDLLHVPGDLLLDIYDDDPDEAE